jgi:hypothetical protein
MPYSAFFLGLLLYTLAYLVLSHRMWRLCSFFFILCLCSAESTISVALSSASLTLFFLPLPPGVEPIHWSRNFYLLPLSVLEFLSAVFKKSFHFSSETHYLFFHKHCISYNSPNTFSLVLWIYFNTWFKITIC